MKKHNIVFLFALFLIVNILITLSGCIQPGSSQISPAESSTPVPSTISPDNTQINPTSSSTPIPSSTLPGDVVSSAPSNGSGSELYYDGRSIWPISTVNYQGEIYVPLKQYSEELGKVVYISEETRRINICSIQRKNQVPIATDPGRKPLDRRAFEFITKAMSGTEVRNKIGLPQSTFGGNFLRDVYNLVDGSSLVIDYGFLRDKGVQLVYIIYPDKHEEIIIGQ